MATHAENVRIARVTLAAGVLTPIRPLIQARNVFIGNVSAGDLAIHTSDDESEYLILAQGYEREIELAGAVFRPGDKPAFWFKSAGGGVVYLEWTL